MFTSKRVTTSIIAKDRRHEVRNKKVIGAVHVALGNNISYGGTNDVPIHLDGVIREANVYVDGKKVMDNGKFK